MWEHYLILIKEKMNCDKVWLIFLLMLLISLHFFLTYTSRIDFASSSVNISRFQNEMKKKTKKNKWFITKVVIYYMTNNWNCGSMPPMLALVGEFMAASFTELRKMTSGTQVLDFWYPGSQMASDTQVSDFWHPGKQNEKIRFAEINTHQYTTTGWYNNRLIQQQVKILH